MKRLSQEDIIVAIDVGTTKICVLVAQIAPDHSVNIIGIGQAPSAGLARGVVVTMAPAVHAVQSALREAELMAGTPLNGAYVGISGAHIRAFSSHGMVAIKDGEIQQRDIANVLQAAQAVTLPEGQQILHAVPHYFCINGNDIVHNPLGMHGVRLEAHVHIVTGAVASVQNLIRCCELAGITVRDIILEPIASADAVLTQDERELGVGIFDIGGGTSDFAVYHRGSICHTCIIPLAGNVFTHDIAVCLHVALHDAERLKRLYGMDPDSSRLPTTALQLGDTSETIIRPEEVALIVEPRAEEILLMLADEIERNKLRQYMPAGIVLTGGGSLLAGLQQQALQRLRMPVRIGKPRNVSTAMATLDNPLYATAYGLLIHARNRRSDQIFAATHGSLIQRISNRMKSWIFDIF
jgi:cell division protein FtsA